jgi:hypothetical protein
MSIKKGKDTRAHRSPILLQRSSECSTRLSTPDRASPVLLLLNRTFTSGEVQVDCVVESSTIGAFYRGRGESPPTWQGWFGGNGWPAGHPRGRPATPLGLHLLQASDPSL